MRVDPERVGPGLLAHRGKNPSQHRRVVVRARGSGACRLRRPQDGAQQVARDTKPTSLPSLRTSTRRTLRCSMSSAIRSPARPRPRSRVLRHHVAYRLPVAWAKRCASGAGSLNRSDQVSGPRRGSPTRRRIRSPSVVPERPRRARPRPLILPALVLEREVQLDPEQLHLTVLQLNVLFDHLGDA